VQRLLRGVQAGRGAESVAMVSVTIDGRKASVPEGTTVLDAAARLGIEIPHLCAQEGMRPYGACRVCTVEITQEGRTRLQAACSYPATEGLEVRTDGEQVLRGRQIILEFLLARSGQAEPIREFARRWGVRETRFGSRDRTDCILCGLCVRGCREVVGAEALGFSGRGVFRKVETSFEGYGDRCIGCGLCSFLCPTGAVQMEAKAAAKLRRAVGTERTCRYMLMGLVSYKTCPRNIECRHCPYDQIVEFAGGTHAAEAAGPINVGPFEFRTDRSYGRNHTWVRPLDGLALVGADHFLTTLLGGIEAVQAHQGGIGLRAGGRELELALPIEGEVVRVNPEIGMVPRLVGFSPYQRGWLALVKPIGSAGAGLLSGPEAACWIREEVRRLETLVGRPAAEIEMPVPASQWADVREAFFGARGVKG